MGRFTSVWVGVIDLGVTYIDGTVRGPQGEADLRFLVDSGAGYTLLPAAVWQRIGLEAKRRQAFDLADGTTIERDISECYIILPEGETHSPVILGEPGDPEPLLGVVTLENLGFVFDPFARKLRHMRVRL